MNDTDATPTPCARGCTITGRHTQPCTCTDPQHAHDDNCDQCEGCQPRPVETGQLCRPCAGRARRALLDLPDRVSWIVENVIPGQGEEGQRVTGSREAPVPLNLTAVDDADLVVAVLTEWASTHVEASGVPAPDVRGVRTTVGAAPVGVRRLAEAHRTALRLAGWHLTYFDSIASRPYAADWHDEITDLERKLRGRYPIRDRATKVPVPCPECKRLMLHLHPPKEAPEYKQDGTFLRSHDITVICHADDCGKVMPSAEYWRVKRSAMTDAYERAQASGE